MQNPFEKYGGTAVEGPFKKYGGAKVNIVAEKRELRNAAARELQASRFPTEAESGTPVEGSGWDRAPRLGDVWTAGKTMLSDLFAMPFHQVKDTLGRMGRGLTAAADPKASFGDRMRGVMDVMPVTAGYNQIKDMSLAAAERTASANLPVTSKIVGALPVVGPMVDSLSEEAGRVGPAAPVGHAAALFAGPKVYGKIGEMAMSPKETLAGAYGAARHPFKTANQKVYTPIKQAVIDRVGPKPADSYFKAIRPMNSKVNFGKAYGRFTKSTAETAMDDMARAADTHGIVIEDIVTADMANDLAIKDLLKMRKPLLGNRDVVVSGKPIADAIVNSVPKLDRVKNPTAYQAIKEWANETYNRKFTLDEIDTFRIESNASQPITAYHVKLPNQQVAMDHRLNTALAKAENNAIRELEYRSLGEAFGTGEAMKTINQRLRALLTNKDLIDRRFNVEMRQAVQNLPQQISKLMAAGKFGKAASSLAKGDVLGAGFEALTGVGEMALADFLKEYNSTSGQLASAFRRHRGRPAPVPMTPIARAEANRSLGPAQVRMQGEPTVQPRTMTGSATPGQPLTSQGWNQQENQPLPRTQRLPGQPGRNTPARKPVTIPVERNPATGRYESIFDKEIPGDTSGPMPFNTKDLVKPPYEIRRGPDGRWQKIIGTFKKANEKLGEKGAVKITNYATKKLVDEKIGKIVDPKDVKPNRGMFHSLIVDSDGNLVDLGELTHDVALAKMYGKKTLFTMSPEELKDAMNGKNPKDLIMMKDAVDLPAELKKNKLARIQYANKNDISVEMHHRPTADQVQGLRNLFAAKPGAKISYDLVAGDKRGALRNGGTADDFLKDLEKTWPGSTRQPGGKMTAAEKKAYEKSLPDEPPGGWADFRDRWGMGSTTKSLAESTKGNKR